MITTGNQLYMMLSLCVISIILGLTGLEQAAHGQSSFQYYTSHLEGKEMQEVKSLKSVLEKIEASHNITFFYDDRLVKDELVAVPESESDSLAKYLGEILSQKGLVYKKQTDRTYVIMPKAAPSIDKAIQQELVSGIITDAESGETLPGVNILVKGTTTGISTDQNGNFELEVSSFQDTLVVSFVGYQTQEVPINGRTEVDVALQPQAIAGEELVVVGYGEQRKADLTGAISSVSANELEQFQAPTITQALQGRIAGAQVTTNTAAPGGGMSIRIRGTGSLSATSEPLYVVDGVPISGGEDNDASGSSFGRDRLESSNALTFLDPADVESIEVLKDASSTAIYGARGTNGVVLITTKKGLPGQSLIDFSSSVGIQNIPEFFPVTNAQEWAEHANAKARFQGHPEPFPDPAALGEGPNWEELIFQNALTQKHNLSVTGGTESTRFAVSAGLTDQQGVVKKTDLQRYSVRANVSHQVTNWLNVGTNINASRVNSSLGHTTSMREQGPSSNTINAVYGIPRVLPAYNEDGSYFNPEDDCPEALLELNNCSRYPNPLSLVNEIYDQKEQRRVMGNVFMDAALFEGLTLRINGSANLLNSTSDVYYSGETLQSRRNNVNGIAESGLLERSHFLGEAIFKYARDFDRLHSLDATLGTTIEKEEVFSRRMENSDFPNDITHVFNIGAGTREGGPSINSNFEDWTLISYLGRINYTLADKYLFTVTGRADGSSKFGTDNKWGFFPSGAVGWRITQEPFLADVDWLNDLKLRISYGFTGNQEIGNYRSLALLSNTAYPRGSNYGLVSGYIPSRVSNPELRWEKSKQFNTGVDVVFLDNRFTLNVDLYRKTTEDLLMSVPLPMESGFGSAIMNVGSIRNQGIELSLDMDMLRRDEATWNTRINIGANRSKVLELGGTDQIFGENDLPSVMNGLSVAVGEPLGVFLGYFHDGIFSTQEEVNAHINANGESLQPEAVPGQIRYVDHNGDGVIDEDDRTIIGNPEPDFSFGVTNDFSWKKFSLYAYIQGTYGNEVYNGNLDTFAGNDGRNIYRPRWVDRWTPENPDGKWPVMFLEPGTGWTSPGGARHNSLYVEDGSYLRLKTLTLGYDFTDVFQRMVTVRNARISLSADNLFTWTSYRGFNPDVNSTGQDNINRGVDYAAYPLARVYRITLQVGL